MSDTETVEPGTTTEQAETPVVEAKAEKAPKVDPTKPCFCGSFQVIDKADETGESVFTTGCNQTTKRQFAQGHDARLVSFLVDSFLDGYTIQEIVDGKAIDIDTPETAAAKASEALGVKARRATENGKAKIDAKKAKADEREAAKAVKAEAKRVADAKKAADKAAKANAPKDDKVTVVEGSQEGDAVAPVEGARKIKIGRYEFEAQIDAEGTATYTDKGGNVQTIERDGYRLLG